MSNVQDKNGNDSHKENKDPVPLKRSLDSLENLRPRKSKDESKGGK